MKNFCFAVVLCSLFAWPSGLGAAEIVVHADRPGVTVSPTLYGLFFEDINRAGDGGLYAEMIQNRSFEDHPEPIAWTFLKNADAQAAITLDKTAPLHPNNPTSLKLEIKSVGRGRVGIFNQGFKGILATGKAPDPSPKWVGDFAAAQRETANGLVVQAGKTYLLSAYTKAKNFSGALMASIETQDGVVLAAAKLEAPGSDWKKSLVRLIPNASDPNARLVLATDKPGTLWFDMISLFPKETYKERPNGWRGDMVQMMAALHPAVMRFPGGSFSEGVVLADAWHWKETLGDIAQRGGNWNIWGYRSTNGIGFHEYLQLAEDLGASPLYVAHVGMAEKDFVPLDQLEPWIQDTLDAIEYANGPASSKWGALRARAGHPEPFGLKYVEIGNENGMGYGWGGGNRRDYLPRYQAFYERIKKAHPEIVTIANIHTEPDVPADMVDEHYYETAEWFKNAATRYDKYDRTKPKIYLGEYSAKKDGGSGNLRAALAEAAFLTGVERNSDVVLLTSYAPLFTNPAWERWKPDAIVFDHARIFGTPSYHVQAMFAANRADIILPVELPVESGATPTLFAVAGLKKDSGDLILKLVNTSEKPAALSLKLGGVSRNYAGGTCTELAGAAAEDENSFAQPNKISPKLTRLPAYSSNLQRVLAPLSVTILRWSKR